MSTPACRRLWLPSICASRVRQRPLMDIDALATPLATSINRWPCLTEEPCGLPHKQHVQGRHDDMSKNLGNRNHLGIPTGNPWNPGGDGHPMAHQDRPLLLSHSLPPSITQISVPSCNQWLGTSSRSCGGSNEIGVKWLQVFQSCTAKLPVRRMVRAWVRCAGVHSVHHGGTSATGPCCVRY